MYIPELDDLFAAIASLSHKIRWVCVCVCGAVCDCRVQVHVLTLITLPQRALLNTFHE